MINIKTESSIDNDNNFLSDFTTEIAEGVLEIAKNELETKFKDAICETHKSESKGTITLKNNGQDIEFEYSAFCCETFKSKFKT